MDIDIEKYSEYLLVKCEYDKKPYGCIRIPYMSIIYINNKNIQAWQRWLRTTSARFENTVTLYIIDVFIQILEEKYILNFTMFLVSDMAAFGFWRATAFYGYF